MSEVEQTTKLRQAQQLANDNNHVRRRCPKCEGAGEQNRQIAGDPDATIACTECDGDGWVWHSADEPLDMAIRRTGGIKTAADMIAQFGAPKA